MEITDTFTHSINLKKNKVLPKAGLRDLKKKRQNAKFCYSLEIITTQIIGSMHVHTHTYIQEQNKKHLYICYV